MEQPARLQDRLYHDWMLPEETRSIRAEVRQFVDAEVLPVAGDLNTVQESTDAFPRALFKRMAEMQLFAVPFSSAESGRGLRYPLCASTVVMEELAYASDGLATIFDDHCVLPGVALLHGAEETRQRYLTRLIDGTAVACMAITEPDAGSDLRAETVTTRAELRGDHYVLNGHKRFITNAPVGDFMTTLCVLDGALSMVVGVFLAIGQWDLKRLLAYHSISQIGYVILGIGLGTPLGIMGGLFHLLNHSFFKSLLFLDSGAIEYATGTRDLREMGGLRSKMPVTSTTTLIASLSIAGIPPFNGFWSKLLIILAAVEAERYGYAFWAVLASILTLASFMKVMRYAFFGPLRAQWERVKEAPIFMQVSVSAFACLCVLGGLLLLPDIREPFLGLASNVLMRGTEYVQIMITEAR